MLAALASRQDERVRFDELVARTGAISRTRAARLIRAGAVSLEGEVMRKCGQMVAQAPIPVIADPCPYVSRGGVKLAAALQAFTIDVTGLRALDIGMSTGGFADCLLQHGAAHVTGVDVGHGQLAQSLQNDLRVYSLEGVNARELRAALPQHQPGDFDIVTIDVSFISLRLILPEVAAFHARDTRCIALVKPQFEAGREHVRDGGVVRDAAVHEDVLTAVVRTAEEYGLRESGRIESPIAGTAGNREFLLYLVRR